MEHFVYMLFSRSLQKYYVGVTFDVPRRLEEHNRGKGKFTSKGVPWEMVVSIQCADRKEALMLERQIKKRGIKRYLSDRSLL